MTHPHRHPPPRQVTLPMLARPTWGFCRTCGLLCVHTASCACRRGAEPPRDLPQWPLLALLTLAAGVLLSGCVGVLWLLWGVTR